MTVDEALAAVDDCFDGAFGAAGAEVVIEEFLDGEEASFFACATATTALPFGTAQDHKRVGDGDTGPNTGGMGAYSPGPGDDAGAGRADHGARSSSRRCTRWRARGAPFRGVLFAGLMITAEGPKLIEYNVRFGDPEMPGADAAARSDLLELLKAARRRPARPTSRRAGATTRR